MSVYHINFIDFQQIESEELGNCKKIYFVENWKTLSYKLKFI